LTIIFSTDELSLVAACYTEKGWTGNQIAREFHYR